MKQTVVTFTESQDRDLAMEARGFDETLVNPTAVCPFPYGTRNYSLWMSGSTAALVILPQTGE